MVAAAHRLAFVLALVVAFVVLQTGWVRACPDGCADEDPTACTDGEEHEEHEASCGLACTDCVGCSGAARALLAERSWQPMASCLTLALDTRVAELTPSPEPDRIDRPPRA